MPSPLSAPPSSSARTQTRTPTPTGLGSTSRHSRAMQTVTRSIDGHQLNNSSSTYALHLSSTLYTPRNTRLATPATSPLRPSSVWAGRGLDFDSTAPPPPPPRHLSALTSTPASPRSDLDIHGGRGWRHGRVVCCGFLVASAPTNQPSCERNEVGHTHAVLSVLNVSEGLPPLFRICTSGRPPEKGVHTYSIGRNFPLATSLGPKLQSQRQRHELHANSHSESVTFWACGVQSSPLPAPVTSSLRRSGGRIWQARYAPPRRLLLNLSTTDSSTQEMAAGGHTGVSNLVFTPGPLNTLFVSTKAGPGFRVSYLLGNAATVQEPTVCAAASYCAFQLLDTTG
ncbi:hypothetical protein B0H11DRAFT_1943413 [Mycena galericulata]|nr:hypothetical protein B0H11DRAFT_1943413 [Mycena galericulata]